MEKPKSLRQIALDVFPRLANLGPLAEGPKCREPLRKKLHYPRKCLLSFEKFLRTRHPICGKMDTPTPLDVPLDSQARLWVLLELRLLGRGHDRRRRGPPLRFLRLLRDDALQRVDLVLSGGPKYLILPFTGEIAYRSFHKGVRKISGAF